MKMKTVRGKDLFGKDYWACYAMTGTGEISAWETGMSAEEAKAKLRAKLAERGQRVELKKRRKNETRRGR